MQKSHNKTMGIYNLCIRQIMFLAFPITINFIIGGDAKLLLMVCVSPTKKYIAETMKCLQFGSQARQITKKPSIRSLKKQHQGNDVRLFIDYL